MVAAVALGLLLLLPSPVSAYFTSSLDVLVVVDRSSAHVGDGVNATVYVIWGGTLSDAGYIDLTVTVNWLTIWTESVPLTHASTGVYRGAFPIVANMSGTYQVLVQSSATVDSLSGRGFATVFIADEPTFADRAFLSSYDAAPGQTVNGTLQTYLGGQLADVDNLTIQAQLSTPGGGYDASWLAVRNVSAGTYGFSYTVPTGLKESTSVSFGGTAWVSARNTSYGLWNFQILHVDVADPFLIWVHQVAPVPGHIAFEVWVADPSGRGVSGAAVWVMSEDFRPFPVSLSSGLATTDGSGRASFDFALPIGSASVGLYVRGTVGRGPANQSFTGTVGSSQGMYGLNVQRDNPLDLFEPGEPAVLNYTASLNGAPCVNQAILYTVYNSSTLITYGRATTDSSGRFHLNFTTPSDYASIDLETQGPDGASQGAVVGLAAVQRMPVEVGTLQIGATGHIVGHLPASEGPWLLQADFYPTNTSAPPDSYGGWGAAEELSGLGVHLGQQSVAGPTFELNLTLPSFLPAGAYYLAISALALNEVGPYGSFPLWHRYVALVTVEGPPLIGLLLALVIFPIGVTLAVAYWDAVWRRKRLPPAPPAMPPPSS